MTNAFSRPATPSQRTLMTIGAAGVMAAAAAMWFDTRDALRCYLAAVIAVSAMPIGALGLMLIMHVVSGSWRAQLYAPAAMVARTLPAVAILFVPILFAAAGIYPPAAVSPDITPLKAVFLHPWFFSFRTLIYFALWFFLLGRLARRNTRQTGVAAVGLIAFALTVSLAGVDWAMALDVDFSSSIYGLLFLGHAMVAGLAAAAIVRWLWSRGASAVPAVGSIMLACILIWLYFHAMQFIIVWTGDLPDEVSWYIARAHGGWLVGLWAAALGGGLIPFGILLRKKWRRSETVLVRLAGLILTVSVLECYWLTIPAAPISNATLALLATAGSIAVVAGFWTATLNYVHKHPIPAMRWETGT